MRMYLMIGRMIEISELVHLVQNPSGSLCNGLLFQFARLRQAPEVDSRIFAGADCSKVDRLCLRLFRHRASEAFKHRQIRFPSRRRLWLFRGEKGEEESAQRTIFRSRSG